MRTLILAALATSAAILQSSSASAPVVWSSSDLKWVDNPAMNGARQAVLWGDPARGAYGALKRIAAGSVVPMHSHTNETRVVAVAGTMTFTVEGASPKNLGAQSYVSMPGGVRHAATCLAGTDCVYFETSTGAYDVK